LGQLVKRLLKLVPDLPRLRISSIDAAEVDDDMYDTLANEPRLMPHMHLSLQSGNDMVLKRMKRRHLRDDILAFCYKVRALRPDIVFGADIIAGFPTETDEMFADTLNLVDEAGLTYLHVFPYSAREGTPAAKMPQVPMVVRKARAATLRAKGKEREQLFYESLIGTTQRVLVEKQRSGHTEQFAEIKLHDDFEIGGITPVVVQRDNSGVLIGIQPGSA
jgi:threonylcarbamoyladenosine tRNA methylthiotransferase MtaB